MGVLLINSTIIKTIIKKMKTINSNATALETAKYKVFIGGLKISLGPF
jgi:hypothetical protein